MRSEPFIGNNLKKSRLTCIRPLLVYLSRAKRDSFTMECVLRTLWDCKLELNFVPVYRVVALSEGGQKIGNKIEFFLSPRMYVNGWFFDIYIQGSKKTTLRAESEIKRSDGNRSREFQLSQFGPATSSAEQLWKS